MSTSATDTKAPNAAGQKTFDWPLCYEGEKYLRERIGAFLENNSFARRLDERMENETATDFFEWVDHLVLTPDDEAALRKFGFVEDNDAESAGGETVLHQPRVTLPRVILRANGEANPALIALKPEYVDDFILRHALTAEPEGDPFSRYRRVLVSEENGTRLEAVERRAYRGFVPGKHKAGELDAVMKARELWKIRRRYFNESKDGFAHANELLDRTLKLVDRDNASHFFFEGERIYWETRNRAAQTQKARQDTLGLGWGNHDHHTFRSSRECFAELVKFLERLGVEKRERFYAGAEAGWGAQVMEQHVGGFVVFADVDLEPEETEVDFSIHPLPAAKKLGTVGLWVGLHGESFLEAGMHHLEARFDFNLLRDQLKARGVNTMNPFSDFEFLRQAFTEGERWPVRREKAERLLKAGLITQAQHDQFVRDGAIGSHLENLQRHGGFKGFNQKAVSVVIAATDPRRSHFAAATH